MSRLATNRDCPDSVGIRRRKYRCTAGRAGSRRIVTAYQLRNTIFEHKERARKPALRAANSISSGCGDLKVYDRRAATIRCIGCDLNAVSCGAGRSLATEV